MAWWNLFAKGRKGKGGENESNIEIEVKKIMFHELGAEISRELESIENRIEGVNQQARQSVMQLIEDIEKHIIILKGISIDEKKEPEKLKLIVKENLYHYISHLEKLAERLEALPIDKEYLKRINYIFEGFIKNSANAFEKATILIGKEMADTRDSIRNFLGAFNRLIDENKDVFEREKMISHLKDIMQGIKHEKSAGLEIENSLNRMKMELETLEVQRYGAVKKLDDIKNSPEYARLLEEKDALKRQAREIDREIPMLKQELGIKELLKHFHHDKKKSQILSEYNENFRQALEGDDSLEIASIIKEIKSEFDAERIREIKARIKDVKDRQALQVQADAGIKAGQAEDELKRLCIEASGIQESIEQEKRKAEKLQERLKQAIDDAKSHARLLWNNAEIENAT